MICCWCLCCPKKSQTSICLKPVISTFQQIFCTQHCYALQLAPKYFSETGFYVFKSFNLALLFCLSFTIHIGSDEDLWRGVLDLIVFSQIKATESSGPSWNRNPSNLRGSGSWMCLQALGTAMNWIQHTCSSIPSHTSFTSEEDQRSVCRRLPNVSCFVLLF